MTTPDVGRSVLFIYPGKKYTGKHSWRNKTSVFIQNFTTNILLILKFHFRNLFKKKSGPKEKKWAREIAQL